ncbi:MAG: 3'-5' exonuclease domain-containing protein 2 [Betaproteobacteria bacterium]|nr:MAG: 3'-5' exonuclease domain-containing protein 2 [Betaproteobacteria bacterium]
MQPAAALPAGFRQEISSEELANLPIRRYAGEVSVVCSPEELERALADIGGESVVGFDTETRPSFRRGESYRPCLAQVATARAVYLFQLQQQDFSGAIAGLLGARDIVKVGVSVAEDLRQLKTLFPAQEASVLDAGAVAKRHGLRQTGLRNLAAIFLGIRIPKGKRTSNWSAPRLSAAQVIYAATDAWACRELYLCYARMGLLDAQADLR